MEMYKINSWGFEITPVEVIRKSESSVWLMYRGKERRESSTYYFDTAREAKTAIIDREEKRVTYAKQELERAMKDLQTAVEINIDI